MRGLCASSAFQELNAALWCTTHPLLGLGLGFRGAGVDTHVNNFGRQGIYVSIGYRLSALDMGPCARIRRLGTILGRGVGTSTIRVRVRVRVFGEQGSTRMSIFWEARHICYNMLELDIDY